MEMIEGIMGRRAVNYFDPGRILSDEKLEELLELANLAPSSMNLQPWKVVAVRSAERKQALRKCAMGQEKVEQASAVLIIVADPGAMEENLDKAMSSWVNLGYMDAKSAEGYKGFAGNLYGAKDSPSRRAFAIKNTAFFAMSVMLAARGLGLETHPMDGFDEAAVKKEFAIEEGQTVICLIALGWLKPGAKLLPRAWRRKTPEFVRLV